MFTRDFTSDTQLQAVCIPAWVDGLLYSIGRSPDSVDHEPPHEDTKIRFLRIQSRGKMDFPCPNKVDILNTLYWQQ